MRKVWNRPNQAVWSLVTKDREGVANMNICTYVTSVSMTPKLMLVAVYEGTKTLENIKQDKHAPVLLQLLSEELAPVVRVCGKQSGKDINKIARLEKRFKLSENNGLPYLTAAAGYLLLQPVRLEAVGGDHCLWVGEVIGSANLNDTPILTTDYLKEKRYIR